MRGIDSAVLLSFDVEEFDLPREHGRELSLSEGVRVSREGLERVLEVLKRQGVKATFFCTGNFVSREPEMIQRLVGEGHEVGCHGVDHFAPKETDYKKSKEIVEKVVRKKVAGFSVQGYRAPRMQKIDYVELAKLGYLYDSSVNPTWVPGRYNNFAIPRAKYVNKIYEIPTSVALPVRIPLFWFAVHWLPVKLYIWLCKRSLREAGYLAIYFHPWEFVRINDIPGVPRYIAYQSGEGMVRRLEKIISELKRESKFVLYKDYCKK